MKPKDYIPKPKIGAVAFGSALALIITLVVKIDDVSAAALTGAMGTVFGYLMPSVLPWKKNG